MLCFYQLSSAKYHLWPPHPLWDRPFATRAALTGGSCFLWEIGCDRCAPQIGSKSFLGPTRVRQITKIDKQGENSVLNNTLKQFCSSTREGPSRPSASVLGVERELKNHFSLRLKKSHVWKMDPSNIPCQKHICGGSEKNVGTSTWY